MHAHVNVTIQSRVKVKSLSSYTALESIKIPTVCDLDIQYILINYSQSYLQLTLQVSTAILHETRRNICAYTRTV